MLLLLFLWIMFNFTLGIGDNFHVLTNNLLDNLKGDPVLQNDIALGSASKLFIDNQLHNYLKLITRKHSKNFKRKRSLLEKIEGTYLLEEIRPYATIPTDSPLDISLFQQNSKWYAAALESSKNRNNADNLVIYNFLNATSSFVEDLRIPVKNGLKLATLALNNFTIIAVAENDTVKDHFHEKSAIFLYEPSHLIKIQSIDMHFANDIIMWRVHDEIYLAIAQYMSDTNNKINYELDLPIYKWLGKHFDTIQTISSKGARRITPFTFGNSHFLAIANSRDNKGNTQLYSEIYKYDYHIEKYTLFQRILTKSCNDLKFFEFPQNQGKTEAFLITANTYTEDSDGLITGETDSILYKFIDNYFIPFQSFHLNWLQDWLPIIGPKSEFSLFAVSRFDGVKIFQYDGWRFTETSLELTETLRGRDIKSLRYFNNFSNYTNLVVANWNNHGNQENVFELHYQHHNFLEKTYDELMNWCENGLDKIETFMGGNLFETVLGKAERADIDEEKHTVNDIDSKIDSLKTTMKNMELGNNIVADHLIFNENLTIHNLKTTKINDLDVAFDHVIDIEEDFEIPDLNLQEMEGLPSVGTINGENIENLLHSNDDFNLTQLTIVGTLTVPEGIEIKGIINGAVFDEQSVLLQGNQNLPRAIFDHVKIEKMTAKSLNGQPIIAETAIEHFENLSTNHLVIGGYINDVDIPTLAKYALRTNGNQVITADYTFDELQGFNIEVEDHISGKKLEDLIPIDGGDFAINEDLVFENHLIINELQVSESLNGINIGNGKLDILLKDLEEEQYITGTKTFDGIILQNPLELQGKIKNKQLEQMNPLKMIDDSLIVEGNKTIIGPVKIENFIKTIDISTPSGDYSLNKLIEDGLALTEKEIEPKLNFIQQINVDEIFVDLINGRDPHSFIINGGDEVQIVQGEKIFENDLFITGSTNVFKINNIIVQDMENKVMKVDSNQTITGKHHYKHAIIDRLSSNGTTFGSKSWSDLSNAMASVKIIKGDLNINELNATKITVKGLVNDLNFDKIVNDTLTIDNATISGHKIFENITIDNLEMGHGFTLPNIEDLLSENSKIKLEGPIEIRNKLKVEKIFFEDKCNGVEKNKFGQVEVDNNEFQIVETDQYFDKIIIYGDTFITSGKINDLEIQTLSENTVKIDEPFEFTSGTFETIISATPLTLHGQVENLDFDNIIFSHTNSQQIIMDEKIFYSNLTIDGSVNFDEFVNTINLTQMCDFTMGQIRDSKNLTIFGNAFFVKGPKLGQINNLSIAKIWNEAWFNNKDETLTGYVEFDNVTFNENVQVGGFVDNVSIPLLYENYFSKTKDQKIPATFTFEEDIVFENGISASQLTSSGEINGINLDKFIRTALIDDYVQIFETPVYLEYCQVENLSGDFKVNHFNIQQDLMRYDKINPITGEKIFDNLNINHLTIEKNIKIQNVDILAWMKRALLKDGTFNITAKKTFKNNINFEQGFSLSGLLNNLSINESAVMLKTTPQEITGKKTIHAQALDPVTFKSIKLKGTFNDIHLSQLIKNQAYKNTDNTFQSGLNLHNNISTNNLIVAQMYQGINMTELIANVTNLGYLNNLFEHYHELLLMSYKLKKSIKAQAYFLHHYKIIQKITPVSSSIKMYCADGIIRLASLKLNNFDLTIDLYSWHNQDELFLHDNAMKFPAKQVTYVDQIQIGRYLYLEEEESEDNSHSKGRFVSLIDPSRSEIITSTNKTKATVSFIMSTSGEICTLFIYFEDSPKVWCEKNDALYLWQILETSGKAAKALSVIIDNNLYLIIIKTPTNNVEPSIDSWRLNNETGHFEIAQVMFEAEPKSIAFVTYKDFSYLAIASGHLNNAMYSGRVELKRFDHNLKKFLSWQTLELDAPIQVEFAVLPTDELVLYIVTDNPTEPLLVYRFEGITGFVPKIAASTLPQILYIHQFDVEPNWHFIIAQSYGEINVIQAMFKGEQVVDD